MRNKLGHRSQIYSIILSRIAIWTSEFDCSAVKDTNDHLIDNPGYEDVDLTQFTETTDNGNGIKKYITGLLKLCREMKSLMTTVSGTHNNDPMAFVDCAKKRVKNCSVH
jgi:hypothetical protein